MSIPASLAPFFQEYDLAKLDRERYAFHNHRAGSAIRKSPGNPLVIHSISKAGNY